MSYWSSWSFLILCCTLRIPFLPHHMALPWARWMFVERNQNYSILCIEKYLRNWKFVKFIDRLYLAFRTFLYVRFGLRLNVIFWRDARLLPWNLYGISLKIWSETIILEVILTVAPLCELSWKRSVQFRDIVPYLMNRTLEKSISNTTWN